MLFKNGETFGIIFLVEQAFQLAAYVAKGLSGLAFHTESTKLS